MILRGGSRKVARIFRTTLLGRLANSVQQQGEGLAYHLPGPSQQFHTAFGTRDFGATGGPLLRAWKQSNASSQVYGFSYPSAVTGDAIDPHVPLAFGELVKVELPVSGVSPFCRSLSVGEYYMAHPMKRAKTMPFRESAPVLAGSLQMKSYSIKTRNLASATGKTSQQASGKTPLDSSSEGNKINEDEKKISEKGDQTAEKSLAARVKNLLSNLEDVPVPALGLGLAGAIPFVALTPGIASLLSLPEFLYDAHLAAQAAYGAVILSFLGGPHWGLAMSDNGESRKSSFSRVSVRTLRYVWSVLPSLVAWPALLLSPVPKFMVLITSFGVVCGVDVFFARMGLLPSWYIPLRILLTSIAILSMTSSLIVTAAMNAAAAVT